MKPKLISLNRARERRDRMERQNVQGWAISDARALPDDIDGYALVAFRHNVPNDSTTTFVHWHTRHVMDKTRLPEMARHELERKIHNRTNNYNEDT